jgi:hypothetical protein
MKIWKQIVALAIVSILAAAAPFAQKTNTTQSAPDNSIAAKTRRFAPTVLTADMLTADTARLSPNDRKALLKSIATRSICVRFGMETKCC